MKTLYIVTEAGFEYNDEIYHRPEGVTGGHPIIAFSSKKKAEENAKSRNAKWLSEITIGEYCYDIQDFFKGGEESFNKIVGGGAKGLAGKSFCLTGTMCQTRERVIALIRSVGGVVHNSVQKGTDFLVVGEDPGDVKISKADFLGVPQIDENEFIELIEDEENRDSADEWADVNLSTLTSEQLAQLAEDLLEPPFEVYEVEIA